MVSAYDGSLPTSVMSVPCSVVTTFGTFAPPVPARICLRQVRRGRVRDRVVRVDDVEIRPRARAATIFVESDSRYCGSRNSG